MAVVQQYGSFGLRRHHVDAAIGHINDDNGTVSLTPTMCRISYSPLLPLVPIPVLAHWSPSVVMAVACTGRRPRSVAFGLCRSAVIIGDLEGDGDVEICVSGYEAAVVCANGAGSLLWAGDDSSTWEPLDGRFDGDGQAEVSYGRQIFDAAGNRCFGVVAGAATLR